jgi:hypothetical protein
MRIIYKTKNNKYVKVISRGRAEVSLSSEYQSYAQAIKTKNAFKKISLDHLNKEYSLASNKDFTITYSSTAKRKEAQNIADAKMKYYFSIKSVKSEMPNATKPSIFKSVINKIKNIIK